MAYVYALGAVVATTYMVVSFVTVYTDPLSGWRVRLRMAGARLLSVGAVVALAGCGTVASVDVVTEPCPDAAPCVPYKEYEVCGTADCGKTAGDGCGELYQCACPVDASADGAP